MATDPRAILAFLAVVEHGSFRGAARELGIPRSTLSERVSALEEQLDVELLARTTRSLRLTDAGSSYHRDVSPAFEALRLAEHHLAERAARPAGKLRITAPFELGQEVFGEVFGRFAERYPEVRLTLELSDRVVSLVEEGYDLAIRVGPLDDSRLVAHALGEPGRICVLGSEAYLAEHGEPRTPDALAAHRCLVMSGTRAGATWRFRKGRAQRTVRVDAAVTAGSFRVLADLVERGLGLARMPERYREREGLREVLADWAPPGRRTYAVFPSARHVSPALRAMLDVLDEVFADVDWRRPP